MKKIISLFPATVQVTQEMITGTNEWDIFNCIGAKALKTVTTEMVSWGNSSGHIHLGPEEIITIQSFDEQGNPLSCMDIKKPTVVIFKIEEEKEEAPKPSLLDLLT